MSEGVFPSDAQIRRLSRENALLLGGPAAAILQVAHPEIAAGVAAHSNFRADALGRLRRTLDAVYTITFATRDEAEAVRRRVAAVHAKVRGSQPVSYDAFSPAAQMWVLATLIGSAMGSRREATAPIANLLAAARHQHSLPELAPARTLANRLWPLLLVTVAAGALSVFAPQIGGIAAGFAIIWSLAWRRQEAAVAAIEERDGVRFYVDRTSPLRSIQLVRTPGFGGDFLRTPA